MDDIADLFVGDGRVKMQPYKPLPGTRPLGATRGTIRVLTENFELTGKSNHSPAGGVLWVILAYCTFKKYSYRLEAHPDWGYSVTRLHPPDDLVGDPAMPPR